MGNPYQRQDVSNNIANGNVINADDLDAEFNALESAFNATAGHSHDGTTGEGGPITVIGPVQDFVATGSTLRPKTTNTYDLGSASFKFKDAYVDGVLYADGINYNGTALTVTAAELNSLTGLTASVAELNFTDGVTSNIQTQLDGKQPLDAELTAIAGLTSAADRVPYFTGSGTAALATFTTFGRSLVDDADATAARTTLGLGTMATQAAGSVSITGGSITGITDLAVADGGTGVSTITGLIRGNGTAPFTAAVAGTDFLAPAAIGTTVQAFDAGLNSIAGLTTTADRMIYTTGSDVYAVTPLTSFARTILDDADAATVRATIGAQASDGALTTLSALSLASGDVLIATGSETVARLPIGTAGQVLRVNAGATAPEWGSGSITLGAAVASTTQTNIDFTGIPASARRITVMLAGVSTSGTSGPIVQLGDSGGIETTNYLGTESNSSGAATGSANLSSGFGIRSVLAANVIHGKMEICLVDPATNTWVATGMFGYSNSANTSYIGGSKSLSATLDRIRLTTAGGTDTFDAGTVNVSWE